MLEKIDEWVFEEYESYNRQTIDYYLSSTGEKLEEQFSDDEITENSPNLSELINHLLPFDSAMKQYRAHLQNRDTYCREISGKTGFYEVNWSAFIENNQRFITNWVSSIRANLTSAEYEKFRGVDIGIADTLEEIELHLQETLDESNLQDEKFFVCVENVSVENLTGAYNHVGKINASRLGNGGFSDQRIPRTTPYEMRTIYMFHVVVIKQDIHL